MDSSLRHLLGRSNPTHKLAAAKSASNLRAASTGTGTGTWHSIRNLFPGNHHNKQPIAVTLIEPPMQSATITSLDIRDAPSVANRRRLVIYRVLVTPPQGDIWWVGRRYSEFHTLYSTLKRQYPSRAQMLSSVFPSKRLLANSNSDSAIDQRRERLNAFLRVVVEDPEIRMNSTLCRFLEENPLDMETLPLADQQRVLRQPSKRSVDRMKSMPSLKQQRFDFAQAPPLPLPLPLPANETKSATTGVFSPTAVSSTDSHLHSHGLVIQMHRKVSDPLEYAATTAEKRPQQGAPQSMRKKYGLRRNIQHRNDRLVNRTQRSSSTTPLPLPPLEDMEGTLRNGSTDSEPSGRRVVVLRRAPLGGLETKRKVLTEDDPLLAAAKAHYGRSAEVSPTLSSSSSTYASSVRSPPASGGQPRVSLDDFQLLSIIGKGSYGKVMLARYKDTGKVMAIKVISKSKLRGRPNEIRRVMSERKVLERTVKHPFLVGLQCAFQTQEQLFFCLDYVNGGELFFHLQKERRFGENRARFYAAEITSALSYLHTMDVVYRDLKPENCLLDATGHVKIVDFGLAKEVGPVVWRAEGSALYSVEESGKTGTFCGTPEYLAPEVLLRQRYGKEVDWYCLGAVIYEMLTGLPPFYHQDNSTMYQRIINEPLTFPTHLPPPAACNGTMYPGSGNLAGEQIGRYAQDFVFRMMERDPRRRLGHGVFGTEHIRRHTFFHGIDWGKIYRQEYAPPFVPKVSSIFDLSNIDPEFSQEPIPDSLTMEGQVDVMAEAARAERQVELEVQQQLMAFPSPARSPPAQKIDEMEMDSTIQKFRGFSFVSPYVDDK